MISDREAFDAMDDQASWAEKHRDALRRASLIQPVPTGKKAAPTFAPGVIEGPKPGMDPLAREALHDAIDELFLGLVLMLAVVGGLLLIGAGLGFAYSLGWIDWEPLAYLVPVR